MILNVYCYYNKLLQAFGNYTLDDHEPKKVVIGLTRDLRAQYIKGNVENLKYLELYILGTFDDETGIFTNDKKLLMDLGNIIAGFDFAKSKEVKENGEQSIDNA